MIYVLSCVKEYITAYVVWSFINELDRYCLGIIESQTGDKLKEKHNKWCLRTRGPARLSDCENNVIYLLWPSQFPDVIWTAVAHVGNTQFFCHNRQNTTGTQCSSLQWSHRGSFRGRLRYFLPSFLLVFSLMQRPPVHSQPGNLYLLIPRPANLPESEWQQLRHSSAPPCPPNCHAQWKLALVAFIYQAVIESKQIHFLVLR